MPDGNFVFAEYTTGAPQKPSYQSAGPGTSMLSQSQLAGGALGAVGSTPSEAELLILQDLLTS